MTSWPPAGRPGRSSRAPGRDRATTPRCCIATPRLASATSSPTSDRRQRPPRTARVGGGRARDLIRVPHGPSIAPGPVAVSDLTSERHQAAVNDQGGSGDVASGWAGEEDDGGRKHLRVAWPAGAVAMPVVPDV